MGVGSAHAQSAGDGNGPLRLRQGLGRHSGEADANEDAETTPASSEECQR